MLSPSTHIATAADIPAIVTLVNSAFEVESFLGGTRTDEKNISELMTKGQFFLLKDLDDRLVASIYVEVRGERGYFGMLSVEPAYQGMGLGQRLIAAVEDYCRSNGASFMDIVVLSLRTELPPFYRKLGYVETGTEELNFPPSRPLKAGLECHKIIMSKTL